MWMDCRIMNVLLRYLILRKIYFVVDKVLRENVRGLADVI